MATPSERSASWATENVLLRAAKGLNEAVIDAARGVSRELGAARWPPPVALASAE